MNDTVRLHPEVAEFAAAVRAQLSDLGSDEIEELTGDLEVDLQERVEEVGHVDLGDPVAYARELRAAAELPPREVRDTRPWPRRFTDAVEHRFAGLESRLRGARASSGLLDFLIALRPFWWVIRAWVAFQIGHLFFAPNSPGEFLPGSALGWSLLLVAGVISVQLGRGLWRDQRWIPMLVIVGSAVAVISLPFAFDHAVAQDRSQAVQARPVSHAPDNGLRMSGRPVRNVFAYDADGNPLRNVQLYDQRGNPLFVTKRQSSNWVSVPGTLRSGQQAWNVFPLKRVSWKDTKYDRSIGHRVPKQGVAPQAWELPMASAPAIMVTPTDEAKPPQGANKGDSADKGGDPAQNG